jgi:hypothetical protein
MRTCIYQEGEVLYTLGDCIDPYYPGNPLVDWSDSVEVTTTDPDKERRQALLILALIAIPLLFLGGK